MPVILPAPELPPGPRSALVIATGEYGDARLAALRSPARDASDLAAVLGDPQVGGFAVTVLQDQGVHALRVGIGRFLAGRAHEETVLVYLSCHGVLSAKRRLYFAATNTDRDELAATGLEARWVIEQLDECRARRQVVVLDCCFSGAFALTKAGAGAQDVGLQDEFGLADGRGRIVLTASRATEFSFEGEALADGASAGSVFTASLVDGLRSGAADQDGDGLVSVSDLYAFAYARVKGSGAAQTPQRWVYGGEGEVVLARSPGGRALEPAALSDEIRTLLESGSPRVRLAAVAELGDWLTDADPRRALAGRLALERVIERDTAHVADAARALLNTAPDQVPVEQPSVGQPLEQDTAVPGFRGDSPDWPVPNAAGVASTPSPETGRKQPVWVEKALDEAAHTAANLPDPTQRAQSLIRVATVLSGRDGDRAVGLLEQATHAAASLAVPHARASVLTEVAEAMAAIDPERAARLALSFADDDEKAHALARVAAAIAAAPHPADPALPATLARQAERAADATSDPARRSWARAAIADAVAPFDPERAARLTGEVPAGESRALALAGVAVVLAATDPARAAALFEQAEREAAAITDRPTRAQTLTEIAIVLIPIDPARAVALLDQADRFRTDDSTSSARTNTATLTRAAAALAAADPARAVTLFNQAERSASRIHLDALARAGAVAEIAAALVPIDPARASALFEQAAQRAADARSRKREAKAQALSEIAVGWASVDLDRAARLANTLTDDYRKALALTQIAAKHATTDPDRAANLLEQAERAAAAIGHAGKAWALAEISVVWAVLDLERAARIADALTDDYWKVHALSAVARAAAR